MTVGRSDEVATAAGQFLVSSRRLSSESGSAASKNWPTTSGSMVGPGHGVEPPSLHFVLTLAWVLITMAAFGYCVRSHGIHWFFIAASWSAVGSASMNRVVICTAIAGMLTGWQPLAAQRMSNPLISHRSPSGAQPKLYPSAYMRSGFVQ